MHYEDIKAAIRKKGVNQADIARHLGVANGSVGNVIRGRTRSQRIADAIANVCELRAEDLWPGLYGAKPSADRVVGALIGRSRAAKAKAKGRKSRKGT